MNFDLHLVKGATERTVSCPDPDGSIFCNGGCSAVDIVMILKKQKETIENFEMIIDGERQVGKEPALWETIHIVFKLKGTMTQERAEKACTLSIARILVVLCYKANRY